MYLKIQIKKKIEEFVQARITYATMVSNMDANIGRLIDELDNDMTEFNNTVIIFLSDNGGYTYSKGAVNYPLDALKGSVKENRFPSSSSASISIFPPSNST